MQKNVLVIFIILQSSFLSIAQRELKVSEIWDFEIGDEFQFTYWESPVIPQNPWRDYFLYKVKNKYYSQGMDTVFYEYEIEHKYKVFTNYPSELYYETKISQKTETIKSLDTLLYSYFLNPDTSTPGSIFDTSTYIDPNFENKVVNKIRYWNGFEGGFTYYYIEGFGGWYGSNWSSPSGENKELIYFKKGEKVWGTRSYVGINEEISNNIDLIIYPNPFSNCINIELPIPETGLIKIYNSEGKEILTKEFQQESKLKIDEASMFSSGMYFIKVQTESSIFQRKLLKY